MVIPLRDREQPTKEANPDRSQAHPAGRAPSVSFRVRFLVLEKFQPDRSEDVGRSFVTGDQQEERFARTSVDVDKLLQLGRFLAEVAGQQPQRADGHPAA
jgi:hypothetical protein